MKTTIGGVAVTLRNGEKILWQGRPEQGLLITKGRLIWAAIGLALIAFGLWLIFAVRISGPILGLPLLLFGGYLAVWQWVADIKRREETWYAVTSNRAVIVHKNRAMAYPILPESPLRLIKGKYDMVVFAAIRKLGVQNGSSRRRVAFRDLKNGNELFEILQAVQKRIGAG